MVNSTCSCFFGDPSDVINWTVGQLQDTLMSVPLLVLELVLERIIRSDV